MPKAKAAPICAVKVAVWVMKPGPMAEVAIRNTAAISEDRRAAAVSTRLGAAGGAGCPDVAGFIVILPLRRRAPEI